MRSPHTITIRQDDGTEYTVRGFIEVVERTIVDVTGHHSAPGIEAIISTPGYGTDWTAAEGDKIMGPHSITGLITSARPVDDAQGRLRHVEIGAG